MVKLFPMMKSIGINKRTDKMDSYSVTQVFGCQMNTVPEKESVRKI